LGWTEVSEAWQIVQLQRWLRAAVAIREEGAVDKVLLREIVVDAAAELIELPLAGRRAEYERAGRVVGARHDGEQLLHNRIRHAGLLRFGWNRRLDGRHFAPLAPFIAGEEECLVPPDRPAYAVAVHVALEGRNRPRGVEIVLRVEVFVTHEFESAAMDAV